MTSPESAAGQPDWNIEDLYDNAPCGILLARADRRIIAVNATLANWLGHSPDGLVGVPFTDLFTAGGRIHFETHFAPLLHAAGHLAGVTLDLVAADGTRLPMLVTANAEIGADGGLGLLRIAVQDAHDRRSYERELLAERRRAEQERVRAQQLARTLQRSLLPPALMPPPGLAAAAYYHPASEEVSGDFYDLFPLSRDRWAFFLGDVCGKGAEAASVTSLTRYTLRAAAVIDGDPVAVLQNLDAVLKQEREGGTTPFCTVLFGVLERRGDGFDVHLAGGGHPPAVLISADGAVHEAVSVGGMPAGITVSARFVSTRMHLSPGDTLVLYTDGLSEARIGAGVERYNDDGALLRFAAAHAPTTPADFIAAVQELLEQFGSGVEDDAAVLALGVPR
ncbi:PP2C family protein-serine/threonine phosphatase [Mycobacterium sp. NPDC050041]|uniref:PP2C family protein-serine/threonine phosphatase n=1 Tax=Mycobacterium sp. NPDC050041 TaxID=3364293 RepID=UPI003C3071D8